ncbi:DUF4160 domain-containing protein [Botrimarina mediterranea]|uniref:DUF4160 domain-containing protein n=1 Tax=Botrimarina mediterranea TaxID=2528022 RepID=UPI001E46B1E4|nr:DUF4160 domain-containing protein [Botrimarina mediterranea]
MAEIEEHFEIGESLSAAIREKLADVGSDSREDDASEAAAGTDFFTSFTLHKKDGIQYAIRYRETNHHLPHIHAKYQSSEASIAIDGAEVIAGSLPPSKEPVARGWVVENGARLKEVWDKAKSGEDAKKHWLSPSKPKGPKNVS